MPRLAVVLVALSAIVLVAAPTASAHKLSFSKAKKTAQARADAFAGQRTDVNSLFRTDYRKRHRHAFYAQARWTYVDPTGCKGCEYDETTDTIGDGPTTVYCSIEMRVRFRSARSRKVVAKVVGKSCF